MNSDWSENIFDSLMEEVVEGKRPPDLTARIAAAWRSECEDPARAESFAHESSHESELQANVPAGMESPATKEVWAPLCTPTVLKKYRKPSKHNRGWSTLIGVAAALVVVAGGLQWYSVTLQNQKVAKIQKNTAPQVAEAPKPKRTEAVGEQLSLDKVPFSGNSSSEDIARKDVPKSPNENPRMNAEEIVELIDNQLASLWQSRGVTPAYPMSSLELPRAREEVLTAASDTHFFNRKFSDHFVNLWFQGGKLALSDSQVTEVKNYVAGTISTKPWNEVLRKVIGSDALIAAHAGEGNHALANRISETFLDRSIGCARCHTNSQSDGLALTQDQYWSFVGLLNGLDSQSTPEGRKAVDKQAEVFASSKGLFFERPDKTLEAVKYLLPDSQPWDKTGAKSPRSALFDWISQSEEMDRATVNQVWRIAMGRALVPANPLTDNVGIQERRELNHVLAQQFRIHGRDLRQLVGWVVRSDAFSRSGIKLDRDRWLQATETDLAQWHAAEQTFAARTSLGD
jgi:hypothetical protein